MTGENDYGKSKVLSIKKYKSLNDFVDPSGPKLVSCRSPLQFNQFGRRAIPFKSSFVGCHFESPVG